MVAWDVTHNLRLGHGWLSFWDDSPSELGAFASNGLRIGHSRMNSRNQRDMMGYLGMQDPFMPVLALEYHVVLLHCCTSQKRVHQCIVRVHHTSFLCPCNRKCWLTTVKQQIGLAVGRPSSPPSPTPVRVPEGWLTRLKRGGDARWRGWVPYRLSPSSMGFAWKWMGKMMIKHPTFRQDQLPLTTWIELGFWYQDFDQIGQIGRHQNQWAWGNLSLWMSLASDFPAIFAELICWDQREGVTGGKHRQARWTGELHGGLVWVWLLVARTSGPHVDGLDICFAPVSLGWFSGKTKRNAAYPHDPTTLLPKPCKHLFHPDLVSGDRVKRKAACQHLHGEILTIWAIFPFLLVNSGFHSGLQLAKDFRASCCGPHVRSKETEVAAKSMADEALLWSFWYILWQTKMATCESWF